MLQEPATEAEHLQLEHPRGNSDTATLSQTMWGGVSFAEAAVAWFLL